MYDKNTVNVLKYKCIWLHLSLPGTKPVNVEHVKMFAVNWPTGVRGDGVELGVLAESCSPQIEIKADGIILCPENISTDVKVAKYSS